MARAHAILTTDVTTAHLGYALTHDVLTEERDVLVPKGTVLDEESIDRLRTAPTTEMHLLEIESGEVHENVGGARVARAVCGQGLRVAGPSQSRYDLVANEKGLLRVDPALLAQINDVADVTVYTMLDRQPVAADTVVASVKITPIAIAEERIAQVEHRSAGGPVVWLRPFQPKRVGVLALDGVDAGTRSRFETAIERRLHWYGSSLLDLRYVQPNPESVADALREFLDQGAGLILTGGGNTIDPLDPIERALEPAGGRLVHRGAPTRGSMFWLAQAGDVPIINLASCRMWTGNALGDLILPLVMAGETVTREDILAIGYGGLPGSAVKLRFAPYDD